MTSPRQPRHCVDPRCGLSLLELLLSLAIVTLLGLGSTALVSACLDAQDQGESRVELYREGLLVMNRIAAGVKRSAHVAIPNAHATNRTLLVFSGMVNVDADFYFNDPLFPRYDEDLGADMSADGQNGLLGIDDDGDGLVDEPPAGGADDDEDGLVDEEIYDGIDNDGDGNVDEDLGADMNGDGAPGLAGVDDDADGQVDEGGGAMAIDDDEDGVLVESGIIPVFILWNTNDATLTEGIPFLGQANVLSDRVKTFAVVYEGPERISVSLELTNELGDTASLFQYVCPRNILQKTGKRVR